MITFKCENCGSQMESPESLAGRTEDCPSCGIPCQVPKPLRARGVLPLAVTAVVALVVGAAGGSLVTLAFWPEDASASRDSSSREQSEGANPIDSSPFMNRLEKIAENVQESDEREEKIKAEVSADRSLLHPKAIAAFKDAASKNFGSDVAKTATYEVVKVGDFGDEKWKVYGVYRGGDGEGRQMEADWVVTFEIFGGNLQTTRVKLADRRYGQDGEG